MAFGARAAVIATAAATLATETSATAAPTTATAAVGPAFTAILTAGVAAATFGRADFIARIGVLEVRVARCAVTAPITSTTAATAVASIAAVFAFAARLAIATTAGSGRLRRFLASEETPEPSEEAAGFFRRRGFFMAGGPFGAIRTFATIGVSAALLVRLIGAWLVFAVFAARLAGSGAVDGFRLA